MSVTGWIATVVGVLVAGLAALVGAAARRPTRPCRACVGLGLRRGARGRWASFCPACRGGGQVDSWATRVLVIATRGRWLPAAGTVARGVQFAQTWGFAGRHPGGRWRTAPDPDDTRLAALRDVRVPAAERRVERRHAAHTNAQGLVQMWTWVRLVAARRVLRRAVEAVERHRDALADHCAGYRGAARRPRRRRPG